MAQFLLAFIVTFALTRPARAMPLCAESLSSNPAPIHHQLLDWQRETIRSHAIYQFAHLRFSNQLQVNFINETTKNGEAIQAQFLSEILRVLKPSITFVRSKSRALHSDANGKIDRLAVEIYDSAEFNIPEPHTVQMPLLKAANLGTPTLNKAEIRKLLGISSDARVLHIYGTSNRGRILSDNPNNFVNIFTSLKAGGIDFDVVILSKSGFEGGDLEIQPDAWLPYGYPIELRTIQPLSFLSHLSRKRTAFVLNRTFGEMLNLHRAADLSIIRGPINFFEPLNAGTPTLLINNPKVRSNYDLETLNAMIETAREDHNFKESNGSNLAEATKALLSSKNLFSNGNSIAIKQRSFSKLLDHLLQVFENFDSQTFEQGPKGSTSR